MGKLGQDFELGQEETTILKKIRSKRGIIIVSLVWKGELKEQIKWQASCNNPKQNNLQFPLLIVYGSTPLEALKKLTQKLEW